MTSLTSIAPLNYRFIAMVKKMTYREAGVDIDAGGELVDKIGPAVKSTMRPEVMSRVGGFASLVSIPPGMRDPVLVSGTDGVGTKLKIAFAMDDHDTVGIDLVAMCVNDVLATGAEPLFFLDYYACAGLKPDEAAAVIGGIAEGCRQSGCALVGGETAELPGFYQPDEYDLAGFVVGVVERDKVVSGDNVKVGDAVIGLESTGLHSNGFSLARAVAEKAGVQFKDTPEGFDKPLGTILLTPTKIYVKAVQALIAEVDVHALAHITGGGLVENIPRTIPEGLGVHLKAGWSVPEIFRWIAANGPVEEAEMLRTFNMGVGMTVIVPNDKAEQAVKILETNGVKSKIIGEVVKATDGQRVKIEGTV